MRAPKQTKNGHKPSFPAGLIGFALGDVHGRADLLRRMLDQITALCAREPNAQPVIVFAGDYIDRGPQSREVIELLLSERLDGFQPHFLLGNHEQLMLDFLDDPQRGRRWLDFGGANTMLSYGVRPPPISATPEELEDAGAALRARIPAHHHAFFRGLERYVELGDYLFVHAGVDPSKPLTEQTDADLLWIRDRFIKHRKPMSHRVVHGHTPVRAACLEGSRIAIDTGAFATGLLSAVRLEGSEVSFLSTRAAGVLSV